MMTDQLLVLEAHFSISVVHIVSLSVWLINYNRGVRNSPGVQNKRERTLKIHTKYVFLH